MAVVSIKNLLESGVHFGHITKRWDPKMKPYIYTKRNGIYIIDLQKTAKKIEEAYKVLFDIAKDGGRVIFVGTKKQAREAVEQEAKRCGQFYVNNSWKGGTMTNFKTISASIKRLHTLERMEADGVFNKYTKKEAAMLKKDMEKLEKAYGGIKDMKGLPQAIFVVDPKVERSAVLEARKLNIPVFGIVDTNCDPDDVDYVIPANDDAIRAVQLVVATMANAVIEANGGDVPKYDDKEDFKKIAKEVRENEAKRPQGNGNRQQGNGNRPQGNRKPGPRRDGDAPRRETGSTSNPKNHVETKAE